MAPIRRLHEWKSTLSTHRRFRLVLLVVCEHAFILTVSIQEGFSGWFDDDPRIVSSTLLSEHGVVNPDISYDIKVRTVIIVS